MSTISTPIIAVVGRPNVGKSTFFNRVLGKQQAVVEDVPGVTRDRNYAHVEERYTVPFYLVDTGGFEKNSDDEMQRLVSEQVCVAVEEADAIICVFDAQVGAQPGDSDVVAMLRQFPRLVRYAVNKVDGKEQSALLADFYSLGIDDLTDVSALHGRGISVFIEETLQLLPAYPELLAQEREREELEKEARANPEGLEIENPEVEGEEFEKYGIVGRAGNLKRKEPPTFAEAAPEIGFAPVFVPGEDEGTAGDYEKQHRILPINHDNSAVPDEDEAEELPPAIPPPKLENIKVALIGRPNVGKSTLLNTFAGEQRALTSPIAGTTRDSINFKTTRDGQNFEIIDTAGLRKKARVGDRLEQYSALRSLRAITECDVAVVLLDASQPVSDQDAKIVGLAHEEGKGIVIAVNKWDLVEKTHTSVKDFERQIREVFKFSPYAPIVFISAISGRRCTRILDAVKEVGYSRAVKVGTYQINRALERAIRKKTPPVYRGRPIKLFFATQVETCPPRFVLFFNYPAEVHFSYLRYLKNSLREAFGFPGTDIKLVCRKR